MYKFYLRSKFRILQRLRWKNGYKNTRFPKIEFHVRFLNVGCLKTQGVTVSPPLGNFVPKFIQEEDFERVSTKGAYL